MFHQGAQNFLEVLSIFMAYQNFSVILAPRPLESISEGNILEMLISDSLLGLLKYS